MNEIIIAGLPRPKGGVSGCWCSGYPVHKGNTEDSLNYATLYASLNNIIPDNDRLIKEFDGFKETLKKAGFRIHIIPFPEELNKIDNLHHDAVFVRDSGIFFDDFWIKANFSVRHRQAESDVYAPIMAKMFNKEIIELPEGAFLEFGEVFYLETRKGRYYFGGTVRSNEQGHDFVRDIIKPDNYLVIKSKGYHLDTVFSPVISSDNDLIAFIVTKELVAKESIKDLEKFGLEIIYVDRIDSSGEVEDLGNYAVNTLIAPGLLLNCAEFQTPGVEDRLEGLGIKRYVSPLADFRFAGGSFHCLTNEMH